MDEGRVYGRDDRHELRCERASIRECQAVEIVIASTNRIDRVSNDADRSRRRIDLFPCALSPVPVGRLDRLVFAWAGDRYQIVSACVSCGVIGGAPMPDDSIRWTLCEFQPSPVSMMN
jgi:hypothetical protein